MQTVTTIREMREAVRSGRRDARTIGLVPTMGYLHRGHMALVDRARAENGLVAVSIFVNPTQFAPNEDFVAYPRDLDRDRALCAAHGVDLVFAPSVAEMYPEPADTFVEVASLSSILIGRRRPGHFRGVATVVAKLFGIVEPTRAYFGEKDFQQLAVIRRMVRDLSMPVEIVGVPTVREADGAAASSRNVRLSAEQRVAAAALARALGRAEASFRAGERDPAGLIGIIRAELTAEPLLRIVSIDVCDAETLRPIETLGVGRAVVLLSMTAGEVTLIDERELVPAGREEGSLR